MAVRNKPRAKALLIAGPTASGKSALALALGERLGGLIINADSMQVYRELRVLTARPSPADEARVPHALYGIVSAAEPFSVAAFLDYASKALARARREGRLAIFVGGTGLYFHALLRGLARIPPVPPEIRAEGTALMAALGPSAFHARLASLDPAMAARLRPTDRQRLERAYAVYRATGRSLASWQAEPQEALLAEEDTARFVVMPERRVLHARAEARFERMVAQGALQEARALAALGLPPSSPALKALGVPALLRHIAGEASLEEAAVEAKTATRRYIKRQSTWLRRHMISWSWLHEQFSETNLDEIFTIMAQEH
jgi:tRNA dimethylallyltransferase